MEVPTDELIRVARAEVERMQAAITGTEHGANVRMTVGQFSRLAGLIAALCDRQPKPDPAGFGEARYWVPLDYFVRTRDTAQRLAEECSQLRHRSTGPGDATLTLDPGNWNLPSSPAAVDGRYLRN